MRVVWLVLIAICIAAPAAWADQGYPYDGMVVLRTQHSFADLVARTEKAVADSGLAVVTKASASAGAASRGITIPGNVVLGVFRNDFATRMLAQSIPAGIEAPVRIYITETADHTATLAYRRPSAIFAAYGGGDLAKIGHELDGLFQKIATEATAQ